MKKRVLTQTAAELKRRTDRKKRQTALTLRAEVLAFAFRAAPAIRSVADYKYFLSARAERTCVRAGTHTRPLCAPRYASRTNDISHALEGLTQRVRAAVCAVASGLAEWKSIAHGPTAIVHTKQCRRRALPMNE